MKIKSLVILLIGALIFSSCSKDEQHKYSCDENVNEFVSENKEVLADIIYDEIIEYDLESQKAIFRLLTPEKRYEMWQGKLSWAVSEGGLSNSERDRVIEFKNTIKASWFDESYLSNEENAVYIHDYYMSWIAESIIDIGMSENLVYSILVRLDKSDDQFHSLNIGNSHYDAENNNSYHKEDGSGTCECSNTSDWCDSSGGGAIAHCKLNAENCTHSTLGCGTLWTYTCDGMCVLGPEDPGTE